MPDFHPLLTSFPIALISVALISEGLAYWTKKDIYYQFNFYSLNLGAAFSLLAFITGLLASTQTSQTFLVPDQAIAYHYLYAKLILFLFIPLLLFRYLRTNNYICNSLYFCFLIVQFVLIAYTSHIGGELVFQHGAGVHTKIESLK